MGPREATEEKAVAVALFSAGALVVVVVVVSIDTPEGTEREMGLPEAVEAVEVDGLCGSVGKERGTPRV